MSNFGIDLLTGNVYLFAGIQSGDNGYRMSVNSEYEFELLNNLENKIIPNKGRIIPKQE